MSINSRINALNISGLMVLGLLSILASLYFSRENIREEISTIRTILIEERKTQLNDLIDNAYSVLSTANYYQDARNAIGNMRFGIGKKNYFFIVDMDGMMLVHPEHPEMVGKIQNDLQDADGRKIILEILEMARKKEEGFLQYQWAKPGTAIPVTKLTSFKVFKNWKWVLCTGIYLDDIEQVIDLKRSDLVNTMSVHIRYMAGIILLILVIVMAMGVRVTQKISNPITRAITRLNTISQQVSSASLQVVGSGRDMADNVSAQTSAVQTIRNSLEKIVSNTRQNVENTDAADKLMSKTHQAIFQTDQSINTLDDSMKEITQASQETIKIVESIDRLAFQTRIVALNAAVEAARAGEAGAGFSVIANEIKKLADNSADAARDTSHLIERTIQRVENGARHLCDSKSTFADVLNGVQKTGDVIREISSRSHQQYQEIEQVHGSAVMMDRIIAQNSEKAGESNLAANDMKNQAKQMNTIMIDLVSLVSANKKPLGPQNQSFRFANRITSRNSFDETALQNAVS